jgi:hypothetical protein
VVQARPDSPRPRPRAGAPAAQVEVTRAALAPAISPLAIRASQRPLPRPEAARRPPVQLASAAAVRVQPAPGPIVGTPGSVCGVAGIRGRTLPPIASNVRGCGIDNPVRVTSVAGVALSPAPTLDCDTARALHNWVQTAAKPAIGTTGGGIVEIQVMAHYVCRSQNNRPGARLSEHGRGKAIDIGGFRLASGQVITVLGDWRRSSRFSAPLRAMHRAACGIFGTTLGPGSDGFHENHFHFDTARHRSGPYCR